MSEMSKELRAKMRAKAKRYASERTPEKIDASDWKPSEPLNSGSQTGMRPLSRRQYKRGGSVTTEAGPPAKFNAGRVPRKSGGSIANSIANTNQKDANDERDGTKHVGGMKSGGRAAKAAGGSQSPPDYDRERPPALHGGATNVMQERLFKLHDKHGDAGKAVDEYMRSVYNTPKRKALMRADAMKELASRKPEKAEGGPISGNFVPAERMSFRPAQAALLHAAGMKKGGRSEKASGGRTKPYASLAEAKEDMRGMHPADFSKNLGKIGVDWKVGDQSKEARQKAMEDRISGAFDKSGMRPKRASGGATVDISPKHEAGDTDPRVKTAPPVDTAPKTEADKAKVAQVLGTARKGGGRTGRGLGGIIKGVGKVIGMTSPAAMLINSLSKKGGDNDSGDDAPSLQVAGKKRGGEAKKCSGGMARADGGRIAKASGGRAKGKTKINVNVIIGGGHKGPAAGPLMPPPGGQGPSPVIMPPKVPPMAPPGGPPPMPPAGMAPPPMGPPMMPPMGPPPGGPPMMPRKTGGRVKMHAGAGSGLGRLEKTAMQKRTYP